ncbi:hypothetical protein Ccar_11845 [Clostridium carboxidivorans P7]|uniref:Uncharacterized protein n=1 Tax=Clostridium carboxidivorans P7 TaxID=536227 RepID=C6PRE7_9CLOT|nr:hypothetical protein [Clostridium carboxidivorans]AKN31518.1 hypothetical protein Ccar_11845 [Clostridium carboxidivorans P7]EET88128.1 hypothetical protein CcarbDRAFT_1364 [Clostridium carboxidivorans P7]EFG87084.1 hypothetical protein CLCAR_3184 [Clostridium carboxidivorans P7]
MLNYYKKHINNIYNFNFFNALFILTAILNGILLLAAKTNHINFGHNSPVNNLFSICDFYLLIIYVILIIFTIGMDFKNSMSHISLSASKSKSNDYIIKKIITIISQYSICYVITLINIIYCYNKFIKEDNEIKHYLLMLVISSAITTIFVTSITLFFIVLIKDIPKTIIVVTSLYFVEEYLWRGKIMQKYGILAHRFYWNLKETGFNLKVKLVYLVISIVLIIFSYFWLGRGSKSNHN